ncbi:MAG: hypothetical protein QOG31_1747 [Thermoplasmata archaeon]|jgi:hypothetical protein|nr:hypothetical protein [Thermoplasmata archaeon]
MRPARSLPAMRALPVLLLFVALAALPAVAQHNHVGTATAIIAHDTPPDGRTYVGDVTGFAVVDDADHDLQPDVHQNNHIRVSENGAVLWEASADAGHDYDGVNTFSVVFPVAGSYEVALVADDGTVQARHTGNVSAAHAPATATVDLQAPASVPALQAADFTLKVSAPAGLLDHSDAIFEVREGSDLVFRTHAHTHTEPMALSYAFSRPGTYTVSATGYLAFATGKGTEFAPVHAEKTVTVGLPAVQGFTPVAAAPTAVGDNIVTAGTTQGGDYKLFGTYDPYTVVGPGTQMHLAALVMDPATLRTVQHVDFKATLTGPLGTVFSSQSLHEYDGIYELAAKQPTPGAYTLTIDATRGAWSGHLVLPYSVALTPTTSGFGPVTLKEQAQPIAAGTATTLTLAAVDAAGMPYKHSEVDVVVLDAHGNGLLWTKLHTHDDGQFPLTYAFPAAGAYTLRVAPTALDGAPLTYLGGALSAAVDIPVTVGAGPGIPTALIQPAADAANASQTAPDAGLLLLAGALGLAAALRRRA